MSFPYKFMHSLSFPESSFCLYKLHIKKCHILNKMYAVSSISQISNCHSTLYRYVAGDQTDDHYFVSVPDYIHKTAYECLKPVLFLI